MNNLTLVCIAGLCLLVVFVAGEEYGDMFGKRPVQSTASDYNVKRSSYDSDWSHEYTSIMAGSDTTTPLSLILALVVMVFAHVVLR